MYAYMHVPYFLKSVPCEMYARVCVLPQGHKYITNGMILTLNDWLNNFCCLLSMSSIGMAQVTKCVANYSQRKLYYPVI